jgi:methionyl aminopeptidase
MAHTGVTIKKPKEIVLLRESGKRLAHVLREVAKAVRPGVTTKSLDLLAEKLITDMGDVPSFKNYQPDGADFPFPASICISVNDEIVHGIPGKRVLKEGDIISLDLGVTHGGMITDAAITVPVGKVSPKIMKLLARTEEALLAGVSAAKGRAHTGDIGAAVEKVAKKERYGIVREMAGHGVGYHVHEDPYVPNYGTKGEGTRLVPGMVIAIEPMFTLGKRFIETLEDGYTISTQDGSLSAHFEHTILITDGKPEILTK